MFTTVFTLALIASAAAQSISIVQPSSDRWWVADSLNTLQWSPCDTSIQATIPAFNVVVMNSNQQVLAGNLSLLGNEMTFECSKTLTPGALPPSTGYTVMLTNAINTLQVYASAEFEVKAKGSTYPPPLSSSSANPSGTSTGTASGSSPSASSGGKSGGAGALGVSLKNIFSAVMGAGVIGALF